MKFLGGVALGYRLNPYFTGLSILIWLITEKHNKAPKGLNPYFTGLSILIW